LFPAPFPFGPDTRTGAVFVESSSELWITLFHRLGFKDCSRNTVIFSAGREPGLAYDRLMAFIGCTERDSGFDLTDFRKVSALGGKAREGFSGENGNFTGFREKYQPGWRIGAGSAKLRI
jgi:hypothetical protein